MPILFIIYIKMGNNKKSNYSSNQEYIQKIESRINQIIMQLSSLQHEKDEESLMLMSDLTAQRDRLLETLQEVSQSKEKSYFKKDSVGLGSSIKLQEGRRNLQIKLVDEYSLDGKIGKVSYKSPLGRNLINKRAGQKVVVNTPAGIKKYLIVEVR